MTFNKCPRIKLDDFQAHKTLGLQELELLCTVQNLLETAARM